MINLAGDERCDYYILNELFEARINIVHIQRESSEVPYTIIGKLGKYDFRRAWYYWVVTGDVPLSVADELYANPVGRKDVRVDGHCGCPDPHEWAKICHIDCIPWYHIDSQDGLNLFADTIKAHGLNKE